MDSDDEVFERNNRRTVQPRRRLLPVPPTTVTITPLYAVSGVGGCREQCHGCLCCSVNGARPSADVVVPKVCPTCGQVFSFRLIYRTNRVYTELSTLTDDDRSETTSDSGSPPMSRPDSPQLEDRFEHLRLSEQEFRNRRGNR